MIKRHPQTVAWLIVSSALLFFCLGCIGVSLGAYWFVFESPAPLTVTLTISRGTAVLQTSSDQILVSAKHRVEMQTRVAVNDDSQAILSFQDAYSLQTVAAITLTAGSHATLRSAERPRFDVSRRSDQITLDSADGQLMVLATPGGRSFEMDIATESGTARLLDDGQYTISTDRDPVTQVQSLHVFNQGGDALLALPSLRTQKVWPNQIGNTVANSDAIQMTESNYKLLVSGLFNTTQAVAPDALPPGWQCTSYADRDEPNGHFERDQRDQGVLHLWRTGSTQWNHAETSCLIYPAGEDGWLDVSAYSTLRLHVQLKLHTDDQRQIPDVRACGIQASECPIMLEIRWSDNPQATDGQLQTWHHGFYSLTDPNYPLSCADCRLAHEHINSDVWYFYDSGDLRAQLSNVSNGPIYIKKLSVYASGHQYDASIGEVTLLGLPGS